MRTGLAGIAALVCALCPATALAAGGSSNGVHVDPGSPAGKQYSIPIGTARGESNGVHVDPGSPAGKQYAIPIGSARGESGGKAGSATGGGGSASTATSDMFGQGVTPSGSPSTGVSTATSHSQLARTQSARLDGSRGGQKTQRPQNSTGQIIAQKSQVGGDSWLPLAIGGAMVLLLGCGGGLALRNRL